MIASLQVNLLSHFFVNLSKANEKGGFWDTTSGSLPRSDLWFARMVGSLADSLAHDPRCAEPEGIDIEESDEVVEE